MQAKNLQKEGRNMDQKNDTTNYDEGAKIGSEMAPENRKTTKLKHRPQHNQPQLRLPPALEGGGVAVQAKTQAKS